MQSIETTKNHQEAQRTRIQGKPTLVKKEIVKVYSYVDEQGTELFQTVRYKLTYADGTIDKDFRQRHYNPSHPEADKDGYVWNMHGVRRVLYNLPRILTAEFVIPVEGEKDADNINALLTLIQRTDIVATTAPLGAGKWNGTYAQCLSDKQGVYIIGDNDPTGHNDVLKKAHSLYGKVKIIKVIPALPGVPEKGDTTDYLEAGHTVQDLLQLIERTPVWTPQPQTAQKERCLPTPSPRPVTTFQEFLSLFQHAKKTGNNTYQAHCPCHDDKKASLSITYDTTEKKILMYCHAGCDNTTILHAVGLTERDLFLDNSKDQPKKRTRFHLTDLGNANRFIQLHGKNIRFCPEHDKWYIWNNNLWEKDKGKNVCVFRYTTDVIKTLYAEAAKSNNPDTRKELAKWARQTESRKRLADMVYLAARQPDIAIEQNCFDQHPFLLNCQNGMLDLATGKLYPHERAYYATKRVPIAYTPSATCPEFEKFLNKIIADERGTPKEGLIQFIRRTMGYTLTGDTSEECLFFLYGKGKNGKTTFINILSYILGLYHQHLKIESLLMKRYDGIPNDIAQLPGARLLTVTEIPEGRRLNESLIKDLTGGDNMSARFLHGEFFSFYPVFKLWMFGNHKPQIIGRDDGIWRRIRLIPFTIQVPEEDRIPRHRLEKTLKAEAEGILTWMVEGCKMWQQDGLQDPPDVVNATQHYREEMDELADFFDEYCRIGYEYSVATKALYTVYLKWCTETGNKAEGKIKFNHRVEERFNDNVWKDRGGHNQLIWQGIGLMPYHNEEENSEDIQHNSETGDDEPEEVF